MTGKLFNFGVVQVIYILSNDGMPISRLRILQNDILVQEGQEMFVILGLGLYNKYYSCTSKQFKPLTS